MNPGRDNPRDPADSSLRWSLIVCAIAIWFAVAAWAWLGVEAQAPASCTITGTLYKADGVTPDPNGRLTIFEVVQNGAAILRGSLPAVKANSGGVVSFAVRRNSQIRLYADAAGFNDSNSGVWFVVPDAPTATLEGLQRWVQGSYYLTATTTNGLTLSAPNLTTGKLFRAVVPASGFSGYELYIEDTNGVRKFAVDAGGSIWLSPVAANPADPASSSETHFYLKGSKLIAQYNDAGTVRYKYLDLTGTGTTWTHTTVAP